MGEIVFIILVLAFLVLLFPTLTVVALRRAQKARDEISELRMRLDTLVESLRNQAATSKPTTPPAGDARQQDPSPTTTPIPSPTSQPIPWDQPPPKPPTPPSVRPADKPQIAAITDNTAGRQSHTPASLQKETTQTPSQLVQLLETFRLYPPNKSERGEAGLGAWFATRMGILIGIIAAVFFGIYVAQGTPAWLRWANLLAVSCSIAALGLWLEKRSADIRPFGRALFAGGLALIYLCTYAAHAFDPIRIVESEAAGALLQAIAVALILIASLWKRRESIAVLALFFGYFSCLFAFISVMDNYAMIGAIFMTLCAGYLRWKQHWRQSLNIALAGTWLITGLIVINRWIIGSGEFPAMPAGMTILGGIFLLFLFLQQRPAITDPASPQLQLKLFHYCNSTAFVALGWSFTLLQHKDQLDLFYLIAAILILGAWLWFRQTDPNSALTTTYLIKGSSLVSLALIAAFTGEVRWIAIMGQAACLAFALKRNPHWSLELLFHAVVALAGILFLHDIIQPVTNASINQSLAILFLVILTSVLALRRRFIPKDKGHDDPVIFLAVIAQIFAGLTTIAFLQIFHQGLSSVLHTLGLALVFAAIEPIAATTRRWFVPAIITSAYAFFVFTLLWPDDASTSHTLIAGTLLLLLSLGTAWTALRTVADKIDWYDFLDSILNLLTILTLTLILYRTLPPNWFLFSAALAMWALLATGLLLRMPGLIPFSGGLFFIAITFFLGSSMDVTAAASWLTVLVTLPYMLFLTAGNYGRMPAVNQSSLETRAWISGLVTISAFLYAVFKHVPDQLYPITITLGALTLAGLWRLWKPLAWTFLTAALLATAHLAGYFTMGFPVGASILLAYADGIQGFLLQILLPAIITLSAGFIILPVANTLDHPVRSASWAILASASLLLIFTGAIHPPFKVLTYATVIWGVSAIALFTLGLTARIKPLRLVALTGLGICIIRLFAHDVQDMFLRIVAFAALGTLLLVLGFLYHKYRDRINNPTG